MKRQKIISLLTLLVLLLLTACQSTGPGDPDQMSVQTEPVVKNPSSETETAPPADVTGTVESSPLPVSDPIDWNDIPDAWTGTGGTVSDWLNTPLYTAVTGLQCEDTFENITDGIRQISVTTQTLSGLRDKALEEHINTWLTDSTEQLRALDDPLARYLTPEILNCETLDVYTYISPSHQFCGNLLSISVLRNDMLFAYDEEDPSIFENRASTSALYAVYDLRTGRPLTISDLFVDGTDLNALLNPMIASKLAGSEEETDWNTFRTYGGLIRPFRGLPKDYPFFSVSDGYLTIHFPGNTPYMEESYTVYLPLDQLQPYLAQPVTDSLPYVADTVETYDTFRSSPSLENTAETTDLVYLYGDDSMGVRPYRLRDRLGLGGADAINTQIAAVFDALCAEPLPVFIAKARENPESYTYASSTLMANRAFVQLMISVYAGTPGEAPDYRTFARMYDPNTGEAVPLSAVLTDIDGALAVLADQGLVLTDADSHYGWYCYGPHEIYVCAENGLSSPYTLSDGWFDIEHFQ